jgi:hypothetical protein
VSWQLNKIYLGKERDLNILLKARNCLKQPLIRSMQEGSDNVTGDYGKSKKLFGVFGYF